MGVKAEDGQVPHLLVESQEMEVQMFGGRNIALKLALAVSIEPAENKSKRFHPATSHQSCQLKTMHCQGPLRFLLKPFKKGAKKMITVVGIMMVGIYLVLSTTLLYASTTDEIVSKSFLRWD